MELEEKIDHEFKCFYLDQMRTSKENIFARSGEIETKKKLLKELLILAECLDEDTKSVLMLQSNLLESAYVFLHDVRRNGTEDLAVTLKTWLVFLSEKRGHH